MTLEAVLSDHFARYPAMQIQDVYKLVHQAALGSEHAIANPENARGWLERELAEMGPGPDEPVLDPISEEGEIMRVHLRPFVAQGGNPQTLLRAFLRTANQYRGDVQTLQGYWDTATHMALFPKTEMTEWIRSMQAQSYPAVHHSPEYEQLYRPAYRVVWREMYEQIPGSL